MAAVGNEEMNDVISQIYKKFNPLDAAGYDVEAIALSDERWVELAYACARFTPIKTEDQDPVAELEKKLEEKYPLHLTWNGLPVIRGASEDVAILVK